MRNHPFCVTAFVSAFILIAGMTKSSHATDFSWVPISPEIGESVTFSVSGHTGEIVADWDFGESGCSVYPQSSVCEPGVTDCQSAAHKYSSAGLKTVTVTVKDPSTRAIIGTASHSLTVQDIGECYSGAPEQYACDSGDVHDDGTVENAYGWSTADAIVEKFTPSSYPTTYTEVCVGWTRAGIDDTIDYQVIFLDDDGPGGSPGTQIASIDSLAEGIPTWLDAAFTRTHVAGLVPAINEGSIYVGVIWDDSTDLAFYVASDESISTTQQTAYLSQDGTAWSLVVDQFPSYRALLVRPGTGTGPAGTAWEVVVGGLRGGGNGFGEIAKVWTECMEVYNGYLYVGARRWGPDEDLAEIWRTSNGVDWLPANTPGFGDSNIDGVFTMEVFDSALYTGDTNGRIWRTTGGTEWDQVDGETLRDSGNYGVYSLAEFEGYLYAGTQNNDGCEVWRSQNGTSWSQVQDAGFGVEGNQVVTHMLEFNEMLYAASDKGIWRTPDGIAWFPVLSSYNIYRLAEFNNHLFTGGGSSGMWWSANGQDWTEVPGEVFWNPDNVYSFTFAVAGSYFFSGTYAPDQGGEVWQSHSGHQWDQINQHGFGNPENWGAVESIFFRNDLYVGTVNPVGLEIWRLPNANPEIFSDGFESGSTSAWSDAFP